MFRQLIKLLIFKAWFPRCVGLFSNRIQVISGPFKGMRYLRSKRGNFFSPKILGTYEKELHGIIDEILQYAWAQVANIGAAEGYYAIGLPLKLHSHPKIIAYESDADGRGMIHTLARLNGITSVTVRGQCEAVDLSAELNCGGRKLVICDTEGYEVKLLDPELVQGLRTAYILVETHESAVPGVGELLRERFSASHEIFTVPSRQRGFQDFP